MSETFKLVYNLNPNNQAIVTGGLVPKGAYNAGTDYAVGDSVDYNGSSYVMFVDAGAGTLPTDITKWQVLANKGNTGATGATGATGPTGAGGVVQSVVAGNNIDVDNTDPANPIVAVETLTLADISDVTASVTEVNYTDGVTSAIQTQLNAKGDVASPGSSTDNAIARFDSTTGKIIQNSTAFIDDNGAFLTSGVAGSTYTTKKIEYDTNLNQWIMYDNDSAVQLNVGYESWYVCTNNTGSTIANGKAVYINGASSGTPTISLAKADGVLAGSSVSIGISTESIANGASGKVTQLGLVNGMDTSALSAGAVYVSDTTAGALTNTPPSAPASFIMRVGYVGVINASTGTILVTPSTSTSPVFKDVAYTVGAVKSGMLPGVVSTGAVATLAPPANRIYYFPVKVDYAVSIASLNIEVTVVSGSAGSTARLGIYRADSGYQPTSLVLDAGTVATDSLGLKTISGLTQVLPRGRYMFAIAQQVATTLRATPGTIPNVLGNDISLGANSMITRTEVTNAYGVFASTAVAPTSSAMSAGAGFLYLITSSWSAV